MGFARDRALTQFLSYDITAKDAVLYVRKATDIDDDRMIALENVRLVQFAEKKPAFAE